MTSNTTSEDQSVSFNGWASTGTPDLKKWSYHPRPLGPKDIEIEISHSGVCGSDIHAITSAYGPPLNGCCIPGHEIVGKVVAKGNDSRHQIGDLVGIGGVCDACGDCRECKNGCNQLCDKRTFTYNDTYKDGRGGVSYGGYADRVRVNGNYAVRIPAQISPAEGKIVPSSECTFNWSLAPYSIYSNDPATIAVWCLLTYCTFANCACNTSCSTSVRWYHDLCPSQALWCWSWQEGRSDGYWWIGTPGHPVGKGHEMRGNRRHLYQR